MKARKNVTVLIFGQRRRGRRDGSIHKKKRGKRDGSIHIKEKRKERWKHL
jgi:hypothetical protein